MNLYYPVDPSSRVSWDYNPPQHNGIDYAVIVGTPVYSAQAGRVQVARVDKTGYGTHVRIEHQDGTLERLTIYGHLSRLDVTVGDVIDAHTQIGLSGNTGNSTGPHLHFELRNSWAVWSSPLDPRPLLPWDGSDPEPPVPPIDDMPEFPELPIAVITCSAGLNVRSGPGTNYRVVGVIQNGTRIPVMAALPGNNDVWLQIGYNQYCAMLYRGEVYAVWE